ncbi:MAG: hypothetical protein GY787_08675, partial [Alteromonadales bacterium]|nr:hypothetical protein [Alteromonadales bacterium]
MIQYSKGSTNGVLIDKVGKSTRGAVQGRTLVGNGQTYVNTGIIPNQNTVLRVWGNFNSLTSPSTVQYHGTRVAWNDRAYGFGINGAQWIFAYGNGFNGVGTSDTLAHAFEINDGKFYVDGAMLSDRKANYMSGITLEIFLQALNAGSATSQSNFNMTACEIVHDGVTYTLNIEERQSTGILSFNGSDGTKKLLQQYLSPATATVVNNTVESAFDLYGGTIADGTQTMDQAGTIFFDVNTPISVNPNDGLIMGYVNGVRVAPEYSGRVRYNRVVCDVSGTPTGGEITPTGYIKLADKYNGITKYDTNRIQTETDGTGKVLPI